MRGIRDRHLSFALAVLTVVAFTPVWGNDFIDMDDGIYITQNPAVLGGWTGDGFRWAWTTFHGTYWQPLSWLSLQGDVQLFAARSPNGQLVPSAAATHGLNLLWHAASAVLLFVALRRMTGARWRSFFVAALFALHPLRVESVAWAAERKDVLSCFFGILTLWLYALYAEKPGWLRYLGVFLAFGVSLLCKPMLMTLPFALLLLDYWPLGRASLPPLWHGLRTVPPAGPQVSASAGRPAVGTGGTVGDRATTGWRLVLEKVPLFALTAAIMAVTLLARSETRGAVPFDVLPLTDRLATAATAYGWYVLHTFYPVGLAAMYPHPYHNWSVAGALWGAGTVLGLTVLGVWQARQRPWFLVGWLWFVGSLLPVSGLALAGDQAWADRFTYWPHIGLLVALVWGLAEAADRLRLPAAVFAMAAAAALAVLATITWVQVGYWRDTLTLWERAMAVTEENFRAHVGLGDYYRENGQLDRTVAHYAECLRIRPEAPAYRFSYGSVLHELNREDEAAAQLEETVRRAPDFGLAWHNLGLVRLRQDRPADAARCFRKALDAEPDSSVSLAGLARALWQEAKRAEAVETFQAALRNDPGNATAWHGLGVAHLALGETDKALDALGRALRLQPQLIEVASDLGVALGRAGRWADAARFQGRAVQLQDQYDNYVKQMGGLPPERDGVRQLVRFESRLGFALRHCGRRTDSERAYRAALALDPEWPQKFAAQARALAANADKCRRDPQQAFELASQAAEAVDEPSAALLDALTLARAALGHGPGVVGARE
jgi:tetratricopeptide (TPR) repeat protein